MIKIKASKDINKGLIVNSKAFRKAKDIENFSFESLNFEKKTKLLKRKTNCFIFKIGLLTINYSEEMDNDVANAMK